MSRLRQMTAGALLPALLLFPGCSGPSSATKKALNTLLAEQNFAGAQALLEKSKQEQYGPKNAVLYNLDMGTVLHHAGRYQDSDGFLDKAESRMRELYTVSATKAAGMLLLNDNTMDYGGEAFERALTNVLRALNYTLLGQPDEAIVEARKVEAFLEEMSRQKGAKRVYKDDAFARYLDSLLYEDVGKPDDARISRQAADAAYAWYASKYNTPAPRFTLSGDGGEVVFIHYNGVAPRKIAKTFQVAWGQGLNAVNAAKEEGDASASDPRFANALRSAISDKTFTVSYPEYVQDPYAVAASEIKGGEDSASTALMEDVSAIAFADLQDRMAGIKTRSIARAFVKFVLAKAATDEASKKYGKNSWQALGTKVISNVTASATEIPDTRSWSTLPSQIRMARLALSPGTYDLTASFKNGAGAVVSTHVFRGIVVKKGKRTYLAHRTAN